MSWTPNKTAGRVADRLEAELPTLDDATRETLVARLTMIYEELFGAASYQHTSSQTVGVEAPLQLGSTVYSSGPFSLLTNEVRIDEPGLFFVQAHVTVLEGTGDANAELAIQKNGSDSGGSRMRTDIQANGYADLSSSALLECAKDDTIRAALREPTDNGQLNTVANHGGLILRRVM